MLYSRLHVIYLRTVLFQASFTTLDNRPDLKQQQAQRLLQSQVRLAAQLRLAPIPRHRCRQTARSHEQRRSPQDPAAVHHHDLFDVQRSIQADGHATILAAASPLVVFGSPAVSGLPESHTYLFLYAEQWGLQAAVDG